MDILESNVIKLQFVGQNEIASSTAFRKEKETLVYYMIDGSQ
jgi:hypothetical protein